MKLYELVDAYKLSTDFRVLAPSSQANYQQMIDAAYNLLGRTREINGISPLTVQGHIVPLTDTYGNAKAIQICKVMSKLWSWGYKHDMITRNPWSKLGLKANKPRQRVWTKEEYNIALELSYDDDELWLLLTLLYTTGQRPIDILTLELINVGIAELRIVQKKTGQTILIPMTDDLKLYVRGKGITGKLFSNHFFRNYQNIFTALKLRSNGALPMDLQLRDIRRTVLTEMAQGGATDSEIRAVSGHSGHSPIPNTVYVQRNAIMAKSGLDKRIMPPKVYHAELPCRYCGGGTGRRNDADRLICTSCDRDITLSY
jgi:integrase